MKNFVITSESVTSGHPDKICDQISDAIVDAYLAQGVRSGIAAECAIATGVVFLSIRAAEEAPVDPAALARRVMAEAGYDPGQPGGLPTVMIDYAPEDQTQPRRSNMVTAFGYAGRQTPTLMPFPIWAVHGMTARMDRLRQDPRFDWLAPDAQAQIAVAFEARQPKTIPAIALQIGLLREIDELSLRNQLMDEVVTPVLSQGPLGFDPAGRFVLLTTADDFGPPAHSGLTGRKSADDAYGSYVRRSGSALSGKDPSRIDRIASYAARQAARAAVLAGLAEEIELQLSYIAGDVGPVSVEVDSFGTGALPDAEISKRLTRVYDFRTDAIAERMRLWELPGARGGRFYRDLATYGHMGRDDLETPWEDTLLARELA